MKCKYLDDRKYKKSQSAYCIITWPLPTLAQRWRISPFEVLQNHFSVQQKTDLTVLCSTNSVKVFVYALYLFTKGKVCLSCNLRLISNCKQISCGRLLLFSNLTIDIVRCEWMRSKVIHIGGMRTRWKVTMTWIRKKTIFHHPLIRLPPKPVLSKHKKGKIFDQLFTWRFP